MSAMMARSKQRVYRNLALLSFVIIIPRIPFVHSLWWRFLDTVYYYAGNDVDIYINKAAVYLLWVAVCVPLYNVLQEGASLYFAPPPPTAAAPNGAGATVPLSGSNQLNRLNTMLKSNPDTRSVPSPGFSPLRTRQTALSSGPTSTPQRLSMLNKSSVMQTPPPGTAARTTSPGAGSPMQQRMTPLQQAIALAAQSAAAEDASMSGDWVPPNNSFDQSAEFPPPSGSINTNIFGAHSSTWAPPGSGSVLPSWPTSRVGQNMGPSGLGMGVSPQAAMQSFENRRVPSAADGDISWAEDGADTRLLQSLRSQWAASDAAEASAEASAAAAAASSRLTSKQGPLLRSNAPRLRTTTSGFAMGR